MPLIEVNSDAKGFENALLPEIQGCEFDDQLTGDDEPHESDICKHEKQPPGVRCFSTGSVFDNFFRFLIIRQYAVTAMKNTNTRLSTRSRLWTNMGRTRRGRFIFPPVLFAALFLPFVLSVGMNEDDPHRVALIVKTYPGGSLKTLIPVVRDAGVLFLLFPPGEIGQGNPRRALLQSGTV